MIYLPADDKSSYLSTIFSLFLLSHQISKCHIGVLFIYHIHITVLITVSFIRSIKQHPFFLKKFYLKLLAFLFYKLYFIFVRMFSFIGAFKSFLSSTSIFSSNETKNILYFLQSQYHLQAWPLLFEKEGNFY